MRKVWFFGYFALMIVLGFFTGRGIAYTIAGVDPDKYYSIEFWCDRVNGGEMLYNEDGSLSDTCWLDGGFYSLSNEEGETGQ